MNKSTTGKDFVSDLVTNSHLSTDKSIHLMNILNYEAEDRLIKIHSHKNISIDHQGPDFFVIPDLDNYFSIDPRNFFSKSQNWIGYVTEVNKTSFRAKVEDQINRTGTYEEVEFEMEDLDEEEQKLVAIGSVFYWSVGYEYRNGTKIKESLIRFKRLPKWNVSDIDSAVDEAQDLFENLNWE